MKTCKDCGQSLPLDAFRPKASNKDGRETRCKECRNIRYNKADPHRVFHKIYATQVLNSVRRGHPPPSYTEAELIAWADRQPQLWDLWQAYVASGYATRLKPSCDRLDNSRPYDLKNLEIVTWGENKRRAQQARREGLLAGGPGGQRPVAAYNPDGSLYRKYISIMDAVRDVNGHMWGVTSVANGLPIKHANGGTYTPKSYKGFIWKWI